MFPVSIIEEKRYNTNKLNRLGKQREAAYNGLFISLHDEINETIEMICKAENEQKKPDIQSILEIFYSKSTDIDNTYFQLMNECNTNISFPLQKIKPFVFDEIFPAYINIIKYGDKFYNEFALKSVIGQYEYIANKIIEEKTNDIIKYIDFYSSNSENKLLSMADFVGYKYYYEINIKNFFDYYLNQCMIKNNNMMDDHIFSNKNISDVSFLDIPVIKIDSVLYSLPVINELKKSMEITSPYLIENTKKTLVGGVEYQTEVYARNIEHYADWYYSYLTRINRTRTNITGLFKGNKSAEEKFYLDNFNRIMNNNANFDYIIKNNWDKQTNIILNIFNEYSELKNYFSVNINQITPDIISESDFIEPYINAFVTYFDQVFGALDSANIYYFQEYTIDDDTVKNDRTSAKKQSDGDFIADFIADSIEWIRNDYLSLKTQETLNRHELVQKISDSMMKNQSNKIAIINDPFNYLIDKLRAGSIIFVNNYFVGYPTYQHYGVYIGNGNVIHFAPLEGQEISFENGIIHETTLEKFCNGRALRIDVNIKNKYSENEIIQRARSRLNEKGYDLFSNNCEHFANWCVTNEHKSYQIEDLPKKVEDATSVLKEKINMGIKFVELIKHIKEKL
jgi:hypothetical protein